MAKRGNIRRRPGRLAGADMLMEALAEYQAITARAAQTKESEVERQNRKAKSPQIVETKSGKRYRATYSPTFNRWWLSPAGNKHKNCRPRETSSYDVAQMYFSLRSQGWKYAAALKAVSEAHGTSERNVLRHWKKYRDKFQEYEKSLEMTRKRIEG